MLEVWGLACSRDSSTSCAMSCTAAAWWRLVPAVKACAQATCVSCETGRQL